MRFWDAFIYDRQSVTRRRDKIFRVDDDSGCVGFSRPGFSPDDGGHRVDWCIILVHAMRVNVPIYKYPFSYIPTLSVSQKAANATDAGI